VFSAALIVVHEGPPPWSIQESLPFSSCVGKKLRPWLAQHSFLRFWFCAPDNKNGRQANCQQTKIRQLKRDGTTQVSWTMCPPPAYPRRNTEVLRFLIHLTSLIGSSFVLWGDVLQLATGKAVIFIRIRICTSTRGLLFVRHENRSRSTSRFAAENFIF
jgi:hypothetical protein